MQERDAVPGKSFACTYEVTVPSESAARAVADRLAERGHRLVAVRIVDHFRLDPSSALYGKPSLRSEWNGWWDVFSFVLDPLPADDVLAWSMRLETRAVAAIAREYGGVAFGGGGGGHPETALSVFTRVGLVHELDADHADRLRSAILNAVPRAQPISPPSAPGLRYAAGCRGGAEIQAVVEAVRLASAPGEEVFVDVDGLDDPKDLLSELFDAALHQDTCYPHTAEMVPIFVALAADDRLCDMCRAWVLLDLFMIATIGRRRLCRSADVDHALGRPVMEAADEIKARAAVADALADLCARWEAESELGRFLLAALAASCPEARTGLRPRIEGWYGQDAGTDRGAALGIMRGLLDADLPAIEAILVEPYLWERPLRYADSPYALTEHRAVRALVELLMAELGRVAARP